jgi:dihydroxyacetone kinase-like protein
MKKFINAVDDLLAESLTGFAQAHADLVSLHLDPTFLVRAKRAENKVAVISGGGSGHEPLHGGYVGYGMLDAACPGQVFTSPTPDQMLAAAEAAEGGQGVLFIVKNYAGDLMNFEMAAEMLPFENATVLTSDDVAVENSAYTTGRRGVAGTVIVEKVVGSLAETGAGLAACKALGDKVNSRTASMGVALSSCTVPAAGRPTFDLGENDLEMGVGIHGEPGRRRETMRPADAIVADLVAAILDDLKPAAGSEALLLANGFGGTPLMELYLLYHQAARLLQAQGVTVSRSLVGNYTTSLEMAGGSITVCLLDEEIRRHWDAPVQTPALRWGR